MKIFAWKVALALVLALAGITAHADVITWTNTHGGQWKTAANWSPNKVPGASDDAQITADGTYAITANASITVSNLTLGGASGIQTLTLSSGTLSCNQGEIDLNGVLTLSGASLSGGGLQVDGTVNWTGSTISSVLNITDDGVLNLTGNNAKYLTGGQILNYGVVTVAGNGSLLFGDNGTLDNRGLFEISNDQPLVQAYSTNHGTWFANSGTFRKKTATGVTIFTDVQFRNSGTLDIQSGTLSFTNKNHIFSDGSIISGAGQLKVAGANLNMSGTITATSPLLITSGNVNGTYTWNGNILLSGGQSSGNLTLNGTLSISGGKDTSTASIAQDLTISGGEAAGKYVVAGNLNLIGGLVSGNVTVTGTLNWQGGTLSAKNILLLGNATWYSGILSGTLCIPSGHSLTLPTNSAALIQGGTLTNFGTMLLSAGQCITNTGNGIIYNYGLAIMGDGTPLRLSGTGSPKFYNFGELQKTNNGTTVWSDFVLNNSGAITVQSGILSLAGAQTHTLNPGSLITGAGKLLVNGATLNLVSNLMCSTSFEVTNGTLNAAGAFYGNMIWSGGTVNGSLLVPQGQQLFLVGAGTKSLASQSTIQVNGYALMAEGGSFSFADRALLDNRGTFEVLDDAPFSVLVNAKATLSNSGLLRRTVSSQPMEFNALSLLNTGTLEIDTGEILLSGGTHSLNNGSQVLGSSPVVLAGGVLSLNGSVSFESPLQMTGGTLAGTGIINGGLIWSGGLIPGGSTPSIYTVNGGISWSGGQLLGTLTVNGASSWSAGTLAGTLNLLSGQKLTILRGGVDVMTGVLNNAGTISMDDLETLEMDSAAQINNNGVFEVVTGTPWKTVTGNRPVFVNNGTFRKLSSSPLYLPADVEFRNYGIVEVTASVVSFTGGAHGFYDGSSLTGSGLVQIDGATLNLTGTTKMMSPFNLASGLLNGVGALDGDWTWSGGAISGTITHKAGNQLSISGSATKTMNASATLINAGTAIFDGLGSLAFYDKTILNNSGLFEWRSSSGFALAGTAKPTLINSGTFRKTLSTAILAFDVIQLQNSGILDVQAGVISFPANSHFLNDGSQIIGSAITRVAGATMNINGNVSFGGPFEFTAGNLQGSATINGNMTWSGGVIPSGSAAGAFTLNGNLGWSGGTLAGTLTANGVSSWSAGTLSGTLSIPIGAQFNIVAGGTQIITGTLNNAGKINLDDKETIEMDSAGQINNNGTFEAVSGTPWKTLTGTRPVFVNRGTFRSLGNTPLLIPTDVEFRNYKTIESAASAVSFTAGVHGFYDGSIIAGSGWVQIDGATINLTGATRITGAFTLASGLLNSAGSLDGNWTWSGGAISGIVATKPGNQLSITGSAAKTMNQAASLLNAGTVILDGTGPISLYDGATINNSSLFEWRGAAGFTLASGSGKPTLINSGTFRKTLSTATLAFDIIQLQNSGILDVQAGVISFPANTHTLSDGSQITGSAITRVSGATMNLSGNLTFAGPFEFTAGNLQGTATINGNMTWSGGLIPSGSAAGAFTLNGNLAWSGGTLAGTLIANGVSSWSAGTLSGALTVPAGKQLGIPRANTNVITGVLNNFGKISLDDLATIEMDSAGQINNNGVFEVQTGTPWKTLTGNRPVFVNNGAFRKLGPTALLIPAVTEFRNYGTIEVVSNVVSFTSGVHGFYDGSTIAGPGWVQIDGATINLTGAMKITGAFTLASGLLNSSGSLDGNWTWSGGAISGTVATKPGNQLSITGSATKTMNANASLLNAGTVILDGAGPISFYDGAVINNSSLFEWRGAAVFTLASSSGKPTMINSGTFRKTLSTATLAFDVIQLQNSGILDVQAGVISFPANTHTLSDGSQIIGPAITRVSGATMNLSGNLSFTGPVEFTAGNLQGTATINGNMTWSGGTIPSGSSAGAFTLNGNLTWSGGTLAGSLIANGISSWSGGTLSGTLSVPTGKQMKILRANTEIITGVLNNSGKITLDDLNTIELDTAGQINNNGVFEAASGTPWKTLLGQRPVFVNNGAFRKLAGGTLSLTAAADFRNYGIIEATTNMVSFASGSHEFYDGGSIIGAGWVEVDGATINHLGSTRVTGGFVLASGLLNAAGTLDGNWTWSGGAISGTISNYAGNQISITGTSTKTMNANASLFNAGTIILDGSGSLSFYDKTIINNRGLFEWRSAAAFAVPSSAYGPILINSGTFRKTVSTAILAFDVIQLQNSGILDIQAGVISFPANTHYFSNGSQTIGSAITRVSGGTVNVNGTVSFGGPFEFTAGNLQGTATINGNMTWSGGTIPSGSSAGAFTLNGNLIWSGGTLNGSFVENGAATWSGGLLYGSLLIPAASQLTISKLNTPTLYGALTNAGQATILPIATLTMMSKSLLVNSGVLEEQYEKALVFSGLGTASFINSGTFLKTVSTRAQDFTAIIVQNSGILDLEAGDITFSGNTHAFADGTRSQGVGTIHITGATLNVNGTATFGTPFEVASGVMAGAATINGAMTWSGGTVSGAFNITGDITWTGGELSGSATENGKVTWSSGLLSGSLLLPAASRMNVLGSGSAAITGSLNNNGQVVVSNTASLTLGNGIIVVNAGAFEVQNAAPFALALTAKATFNNTGTFRKTISTKAMSWSNLLLQNSGTLDLQAGEIDLVLNSHNLNDGSRTTGSGPVRIAGATLNVAGTTTLGTPLILDSGYVAGSATLNGPFQLNGGEVSDNLALNGALSFAGGLLKGSIYEQGAATWTGGELDGYLSISTNSTLAIGGVATKSIRGGTITNRGLAIVTSPVTIQADNGAIIQNFGAFNIPTNTTVTIPWGGKPTFNNYGVLSLTNGIGTFNFPGNLSFFPSGRLEIEVGGRRPGIDLSRIIGGAAYNLDGALAVRTNNGFVPVLGDRLQIINCATRSGVFTTYTANTPRLSADYSATNVTLLAAAPTWTSQPVSQTIMDGSPVTFTGGAYGSLPIGYQWLWNGAQVPGATNAALTFASVHTNAEGNYSVVASNVWGSVTSTQAALTVIIAPTITQQPQALTVFQGQNALFTVGCSGNHLACRWKFGESWLVGATNATLLVTNVTAASAGKYKVEISNVGGTATSLDALLTVIVPPAITLGPASQDVSLGAKVTLSVAASGTTPFTYQWFKDSVALPSATQASLSLTPMTQAMQGSYKVIVANPAGYATSSPAQLRVLAAPQITSQPLSQTVPRGTNVIFSVSATGVPDPSFQWRLNGVKIPGANQPTLLLTNVQPNQSGTYDVTVANSQAAVESLPADLNVITPAIAFADMFDARGILYTTNGYGRGTNCGATKEAGEPKHADKGSTTNSVWISWWAPANGIATFSTLGSDFDTVLAVYKGTNVNALTKVVSDDDSAGYHCSLVSFNAQAGTYYQIAIAGVGASCGDIILSWNLLATAQRLPQIVQAPQDITGNTNDIIALQVSFTVFEPTAVQWFYQGQTLLASTNVTLVIPSLQANFVGGYAARLTGLSGRTVVTAPCNLQINTEGNTGVSARNKFFDAFDRAMTP